ncbi:TraR/DksA C4-type zinc finger protein [Syntrophomonas erecta]
MDPKSRLLEKKQELEHLIRAKQDDLMIPLTESIDELSLYDQHPADIGSELYEREKDHGILELYELELEKVKDALERYNMGQYGVCEQCGQPIESARLNRLVNTTLCSHCAHAVQDKVTRPAEEDITTSGDMSDTGETFQVAGYELYER